MPSSPAPVRLGLHPIDKLRQQVGIIAEQAGLLEWDQGTLWDLFQILARLKTVPDPVAVLDALLPAEDKE